MHCAHAHRYLSMKGEQDWTGQEAGDVWWTKNMEEREGKGHSESSSLNTRDRPLALVSQSGNGWNCVCCGAYKWQGWLYLSLSQTIPLGDGNGKMRINSSPAHVSSSPLPLCTLVSPPVWSFHLFPLHSNMWEKLMNIEWGEQAGSAPVCQTLLWSFQ